MEDEVLVVLLVEEMLQVLRWEIAGPLSTLEEALAAVRPHRLDGALLDINLHGETVSPVAEELSRSVPFLLVIGNGSRDVDPPALKAPPRLKKPFDPDELAERMVEVFVDATAIG